MVKEKRKILLAVMVLCVLFFVGLTTEKCYAEEEDTSDYIEISTPKQLYQIRSNMDGKYKLVNDIDLTEVTSEGGIYDYNGHGWNPIGSNNTYSDIPFTGVFDGQGYSIKGLSIRLNNYSNDRYYFLGLFANNEGIIKNLTIDHINIDFDSDCKGIRMGAVAAVNSGTIQNVLVSNLYYDIKKNYSYGELESVHHFNYNYVGGIAGVNNATITDSSVEGSVLSVTESTRFNTQYVILYTTYLYISGIACNNSPASEIMRCSTVISLDRSAKTINNRLEISYGLFAGISYSRSDGGRIVDSYSNYESTYGGIAGSITNNGDIKNCYTTGYNEIQKDGTAENAYYISGNGIGGTGWIGLNEAQMHDPDFFEGFDFDNTWRMSNETVYKFPQLQSIRNGITKVEIVSEPTNEIVVGTTLKYEGAVARIFREDGSFEDVILTPDNTTGGDTSTTGVKTVTFSYKGASASFEINVLPVRVKSLEIVSLPQKTEYVVGQEFVSNGLRIRAVYNNGTQNTCNDYMLSDVDPSTQGTKTVTVSYNGVTTSFDINYIAKMITGLSVTKNPTKTIYDEGEAFDPAGMEVTAYYNDDSQTIVTDYTIGSIVGPVEGYSGDYNYPISYDGLTVYQPITIHKRVKEVTVDLKSYDLFEKQKIKINAMVSPSDAYNPMIDWTSSNSSVATVDSNGWVTAIAEGEAIITAKSNENAELKSSCKITVTAIKPKELSIKSLPNTLVYLEGDVFDPTGLSVDLINNDGSVVKNVDVTTSKPSGTVGKNIVTVSYLSISTSFEVDYLEKHVTKISVLSQPVKTEYYEGEKLNLDGLVVSASYEGGFERKIDDYSVSGFEGTGNVNILISYEEKKVEIPVVIYAVSGIRISKQPNKTLYYEGEDLDTTGMEVVLVYSNNVTKVIQDYSVGKITGTGKVPVTVNYMNYSTTFAITYYSITGIKVTKLPSKTVYFEGDTFSPQGMEVVLVYQDGKMSKIQGYTVGKMKGTGTVSISVAYERFKTSFEVTVRKIGGMTELLNELKNGYLTESNITIQKSGNYVEFIYSCTDYKKVDNYYAPKTNGSTKTLTWRVKSDMSTSDQVFEITTKKSDGSKETRKYTANVNNKTYYLGQKIEYSDANTVKDNVRAMTEIDKLGSLMSIEAIKAWETFLYENYRIVLKNCGFASYDTKKTNVGVDPAEKSELTKLVNKLKTADNKMIGYADVENNITFAISLRDDGSLEVGSVLFNDNREVKTDLYFIMDPNSQDHEVAIIFKFVSVTGDSFTVSAFSDIALHDYEQKCDIPFELVSSSFPDIILNADRSLVQQVIDLANQSFNTMVLALNSYFAKSYGIDLSRCGFNSISSKVKKQGWIKENGNWYYMKNGKAVTGLLNDSGKWYYLSPRGVMLSGWQKISGKWYYLKSGVMVNGWQKISGKWYYFKNWVMVTGWQKISNKWYYFNSGGDLVTGWKKFSNKWYYFNPSGDMVTGFKKISNNWYYFDASGVMQTGLKNIGGKRYFFGSNGVMKTGWMSYGGKWYYFDTNGVMATGVKKIGTKTYRFNSSGVCLNR